MRSINLLAVLCCLTAIACTKFKTPKDAGQDDGGATDTGAGQGDAGAADTGAGQDAVAEQTGGPDGLSGDLPPDDSCTPPETLCGSACADVARDPASCGRCGHACLGGACVAGQCQPVLLARFLSRQDAMAIGTTAIFSSDSGAKIARTAKDGSSVSPQFVTGAFTQAGYSQDGATILWVDSSSASQLASCEESNCSGTKNVLGPPSIGSPMVFDTVAHKLFWRSADNGLYTASTIGGWNPAPVVPLTTLAGNGRMLSALGYLFSVSDTALLRVPATGGIATTLAVGDFTATNSVLATNSAFVYWKSGSAIVFVPLPNGVGQRAPDKFTDVASLVGIAADASNLYWATADTIETCPAAGCGGSRPKVLAAGFTSGLEDIGLDGNAIYWVTGPINLADGTFSAGSAWRLAK